VDRRPIIRGLSATVYHGTITGLIRAQRLRTACWTNSYDNHWPKLAPPGYPQGRAHSEIDVAWAHGWVGPPGPTPGRLRRLGAPFSISGRRAPATGRQRWRMVGQKRQGFHSGRWAAATRYQTGQFPTSTGHRRVQARTLGAKVGAWPDGDPVMFGWRAAATTPSRTKPTQHTIPPVGRTLRR